LTEITDEYMKEMLSKTREYCIVLLKDGPNSHMPDRRKIVWEHGRRNFALRKDGLMPIVCPLTDDGNVAGVCIFNASIAKTKEIMNEDPGVKAGIFVYEVHPCKSFPGDCLP